MADNKNKAYEEFVNSPVWRTVKDYCEKQIAIKKEQALALISLDSETNIATLLKAKTNMAYVNAFEEIIAIEKEVKKLSE